MASAPAGADAEGVPAEVRIVVPPIYSILRAGEQGQIVIEVLAQLDARRVRGMRMLDVSALSEGRMAKAARH